MDKGSTDGRLGFISVFVPKGDPRGHRFVAGFGLSQERVGMLDGIVRKQWSLIDQSLECIAFKKL